jgi:hypothetical protein
MSVWFETTFLPMTVPIRSTPLFAALASSSTIFTKSSKLLPPFGSVSPSPGRTNSTPFSMAYRSNTPLSSGSILSLLFAV